jgi:hypothetical protein
LAISGAIVPIVEKISDNLGARLPASHGDNRLARRWLNTLVMAAARVAATLFPDFSLDFGHWGQISLNWSWLIGGARKCLNAIECFPLDRSAPSTSVK